ncbi:MAG TPA: hypothetical protein VGI20_06535 [Rhizomicrobium sp.]|jgi:cell division transport system permease protein
MSAERSGRILPRWEGAAPLDVVIAVMAFLAALALCASLVSERTAERWRAGLAAGLTVQIVPPADGATADSKWQQESDAVAAVLRETKGILRVDALSDAEARALVQPWLGSAPLVKELPLPRLVDATFLPGAKIDFAALGKRLRDVAPDSVLDDHGQWISRLKRAADAIIWSSFAILGLIAVATAAAVTFATRAGLAAHHEIVSLLHVMGARTGFIARAFEWHYFVSALAASAFGAVLAGALFVALGSLEFAGVEPVPFLPPLSLGPLQLIWLLVVPAGSGFIALLTARLSILAALGRIY